MKRVSEVDEKEVCDTCGSLMRIEITCPNMAIPNEFKPEYYWAFGKTISSKHGLKETLREIKGETGKEIIEVGNEKPKLKPKRKEYTID